MPCTVSTTNKLIKLSGSLGIADAIALRDNLQVNKGGVSPKTLDLGEVELCDTAGLQLLCALALECKKRNDPLSVSRWAPAVTDVALALGLKLDSFFTTAQG
jgi:anti-anti-sigma regulatory factor